MAMTPLDAYQLVARLHTGQTDKAGRPYIEHLTRVFLRVQASGGDLMQQIGSLFHDTIEDGKASAEQLKWLGVPDAALEIVLVLTKRKGQVYEEYLAGVKCHPKALLVKLEDLADNSDPARLSALHESVASRLREKYGRALQFLTA